MRHAVFPKTMPADPARALAFAGAGDYAKALLVVVLPPLLLLLRLLTTSDVFVALFAAAQAALVGTCVALAILNMRTQRVSVAELAFVAFVLVLLLCTLLALPIYPELRDTPLFGPLLMFFLWGAPVFLIPVLFTTERSLRVLFTTLDALGVALVVTVVVPALGVDFGEVQASQSSGLRRVFGPYGDSIAPVMAFFLLDAAARRSNLRIALYSAALLVTVSIGGIIVALFAFGALVLRNGGRGLLTPRRLAGGVLALLLLVPVMLIAGQDVVQRLGNPEVMAFTVAQRFGSFLSAIAVFEDHVWTGVGYTALKVITFRYRPEDLFAAFSDNAASTASNQYLQTAADAGLLGLAALAWLFWTSLRALGSASRRAPAGRLTGMWAWAVGMVFAYQGGVWLLPHSLVPFLFFVAVGMAIAWNRVHGEAGGTTDGR
jgi:hypothetical protein